MTDADRILAAIDAYQGGAGPSEMLLLPPPSSPMEVARALVKAKYMHDTTLALRHWRGGWWAWKGPRWVEIEQRAARATAYAFTENAFYAAGDKVKPWDPNRHKIADLLDALAAIVHLPESVSMPAWLDGTSYEGLVVSVANGLLDVGQRELLAHDPRFFNATSVPFDFDPDALNPGHWDVSMRRARCSPIVSLIVVGSRPAAPNGCCARSSSMVSTSGRCCLRLISR